MTIAARDVMTHRVISAKPDDTVADVAQLLAAHGVSAVPVCDKEGRLLGMLSEGDLLRPFREQHALQRSWWLGLLAEGTELAPAFLDHIRLDRRHARDLMRGPVLTVSKDTELPRIAELLARHGIKRVPVVKEGQLVGIVSRADIVRAIAKMSLATMPEVV